LLPSNMRLVYEVGLGVASGMLLRAARSGAERGGDSDGSGAAGAVASAWRRSSCAARCALTASIGSCSSPALIGPPTLVGVTSAVSVGGPLLPCDAPPWSLNLPRESPADRLIRSARDPSAGRAAGAVCGAGRTSASVCAPVPRGVFTARPRTLCLPRCFIGFTPAYLRRRRSGEGDLVTARRLCVVGCSGTIGGRSSVRGVLTFSALCTEGFSSAPAVSSSLARSASLSSSVDAQM
jgi:hypothetical protein